VTSQHKTRLFISYARSDDEPFVKQLYDDLTKNGFEVWWDRVSMPSRALTFLQEIQDAIDNADRLILVLGPGAIKSQYVRAEWEYALSRCKIVNPILRMGEYPDSPPEVASFHTIDFRKKDTLFARSYPKSFTELLRILSDPVSDLGAVYAEPMPSRFLSRNNDLTLIRNTVMPDASRPTVVAANQRLTAVHGMGGVGKTLLTRAFCWDCETRRMFSDGVYWITLGQKPDVVLRQADLGLALGDSRQNYADEHGGAIRLRQLLANKTALLVIDDVWSLEDLKPFLVGGPSCRTLITTRQREIAQAIGAKECLVGLLSDDDSIELLALEIGGLDLESRVKALLIAHQCGNLPLALSISGALIRDRRATWDDVLNAHHDAQLDFFDNEHGNVLASVQVSLDWLARAFDTAQPHSVFERYYDLGIFSETTSFPESPVIRFWTSRGLALSDIRNLLGELVNKALLISDKPAIYRLHSLQRDYINHQLGKEQIKLPDLHDTFLKTYKLARWADLPSNDDYLWDWLSYHLIAAGRGAELVTTAKDLSYLAMKVHTRGTAAAEADILAAISCAPDDVLLSQLRRAFANMSHILGACETLAEIQTTLYARLLNIPMLKTLCDAFRDNLPRPFIAPTAQMPDLPHPALIRTLNGHQSALSDIAVSADGTWILSASEDKTLKIWDIQTGQSHATLVGHTQSVRACAVSPDGVWVVSGSVDNTLKVWDVKSGNEQATLAGHNADVMACAVSPDGNWIVSGGADKTIKVWDVISHAELLTMAGHLAQVNSVAISRDGLRIVSASGDKTLRVWESKRGTCQFTLTGHTSDVRGCAISPNGKWIASGSNDKTVRLWDAQTGEAHSTLSGHDHWVWSVAFSPDSRYLVSASADSTLKVWEVATGKEIGTLSGHAHDVVDCAFTPDGKTIVSAAVDKSIKLWETALVASAPNLPPGDCRACDVTRDGSLIASAHDTVLHLWDGATTQLLLTMTGHTANILDCAFTSDSKWIVTASEDKSMILWDTRKGNGHLKLIGHEGVIRTCAVSRDGRWLVSGSDDTTLKIWETATGNELHTLNEHHDSVRTCAISPNGAWLVSGSADRTLIIWDAKSGTVYNTLHGHTNWVRTCAVGPDSTWLVSGSADKTLIIWDASNATEKMRLVGHTGQVRACAIDPGGKRILSVGEDRMVKLWNVADGKLLTTLRLDGKLFGCAFLPDGSHIVLAGEYGVYFLEIVS
jgi:WD40 repeat protein